MRLICITWLILVQSYFWKQRAAAPRIALCSRSDVIMLILSMDLGYGKSLRLADMELRKRSNAFASEPPNIMA